MVAGIRSYIAPVGHSGLRAAPAIVPFEGAGLIQPSRYYRVMAHGTVYVAACEYNNTRTCRIRLVLHVAGTGFDTRQVPNGDYLYCVQAVTIDDRAGARCTPITIANATRFAAVVSAVPATLRIPDTIAARYACLASLDVTPECDPPAQH
jgi:hypothetical protein